MAANEVHSQPVINKYAQHLQVKVGENKVFTRLIDRQAYAFVCNGVDFNLVTPDVVVVPVSVEDVVETVVAANNFGVPVCPRGHGTAVNGPNVPVNGGAIVDMSQMNNILSIDEDNMVAVVEAGTSVNQLFDVLDRRGLRLPIRTWLDPFMQLGAWVACNGNGDFSNQFGTAGEIVVGLEVVLPSGKVVRLGSWTNPEGYGAWIRYVGGPDLIGLFTGSIGTMGIITKVAFRIIKQPKHVAYLSIGWPRHEGHRLAQAVYELMNYGAGNISLHNYWTLRGALNNKLFSIPSDVYFVADIIQYGETEKELNVKREIMEEIGARNGLMLDPAVCQVLHGPPRYYLNLGHFKQYKARPRLSQKGFAWSQYYFYAPILKFPEVWDYFEEIVAKYGFSDQSRGPCLFSWAIPPQAIAPFPTFAYQPSDPDEVSRMKQAWDEIFQGLLKKGCTPYSLGSFLPATNVKATLGSSFELIKLVKETLDPNHIMNPGQLGEL